MKKFLISIALISILAVPAVIQADITICARINIGIGYIVICGGSEDAGYYIYEGTTYEPGTWQEWTSEGVGPGMTFTPTGCYITHNLEDYETCYVLKDYIGSWADGWEDCCLIEKILTVGDYIFTGLLVVAILVILLSAWTFLTAAGEPDKVKKARNFLLYAIIGIAVAFLAKVLVRVIAAIMV